MSDQPKQSYYLAEAKKEYNNINPIDPTFNFQNAVVAALISISEELANNSHKLEELNTSLVRIADNLPKDEMSIDESLKIWGVPNNG